MVVLNTVNS